MSSATHRLTACGLVEQFSAEWQAATRHPFLWAVADGSLPDDAFAAWLAQDYLFVADLLVFQAGLLARAPRPAQAVLVGGLVGLEAELGWFEEHAARRALALGVPRLDTTARYQAVLEGLLARPYAVAITGLWAVERAYLDAWLGTAPGGPGYQEFVEHWTNPGFVDYVAGLERAAEAALREAPDEVRLSAHSAFVDVARIEREFWEMAWSGRWR